MRRHLRVIVGLATFVAIIGFAFSGRGADAPALPKMPDATPPGKPHFDSTGVQVGEQLPDLPLYTLDGQKTSLHALCSWRDPTLLLTSSYSCPKSRKSYPDAAKLAEKFKDSIQTEFIYVIEAHPKGDPSPYTGAEDLTTENLRRPHFLFAAANARGTSRAGQAISKAIGGKPADLRRCDGQRHLESARRRPQHGILDRPTRHRARAARMVRREIDGGCRGSGSRGDAEAAAEGLAAQRDGSM